MLAEPPADSTPTLMSLATIGEEVSERRRASGRERPTPGNMAVEGVDDDCDSWSRHCE
jgi:hypothetical protein